MAGVSATTEPGPLFFSSLLQSLLLMSRFCLSVRGLFVVVLTFASRLRAAFLPVTCLDIKVVADRAEPELCNLAGF